MKISPTQRSLKELRTNGYTAQVVEKFNPFAHIRQDLFGFIDIVAIKPEVSGVLGVQTTTQAHVPDHVEKIITNSNFRTWIDSGNKFVIHGWSKKGAKGKRKVWTLTTSEIQG